MKTDNTPPYKISDSKRYYLHSKIKPFFKVNATRREILVPDSESENLQKHKCFKYIQKLQLIGYNIQITIV